MAFIQGSQDVSTYFSKITDYSNWANFPSAQVFGNNSYGQLGLNTVNAGYSSPVALTNQLAYPAWIDAAYLRNGLGLAFVNQNNQPFFAGQAVQDTTNRSSPTQVGVSSVWTSVLSNSFSTGNGAMAAIKNPGTLWTWGLNSFSQLGLGDIVNRSSPIQVGVSSAWTQVSGGLFYMVALQTPGTLWSWGLNSNGQLGTSNQTNYSSPVQVLASTLPVIASWQVLGTQTLSSSQLNIQSNGTLWSWGINSSGQLGLNTLTNYSSPIQVGTLSNWTRASGGFINSGAIQNNGTLWVWGNNSYGQVGLNTTTNYSSPVQVGALSNWTQIVCGYRFTMAIQSPGTLWAWGINIFGQLGNNSTTNFSSPIQVGALSNWTQITCGQYYFAAIQSPGTLWTCGYNRFGNLAQNNTQNYSSPVQVGALSNWTQVSCGQYHTLAIQNNGTLWAWGYNNYGQLGLNTSTLYSSPVQVGTLSNWAQISSGYQHTAAVQSPGTLWTWGFAAQGQLGNNSTTNFSSPIQVGALSNWTQVACGYRFTEAVQNPGVLYTWGANSFGQLGLNTSTVSTSSPITVLSPSPLPWTQVAGGGYTTVAIQSPGTLWAWGLNTYGQLGINTSINAYSSPVQVGALTTWTQVACGYYHTTAIRSPGTLWSWGLNSNGQLGLNTTVGVSSPVQVGALTTWTQVACGYYHTMAIQNNGTLWSWGNNLVGGLGLNTTGNYSSPVQVGALSTWTRIIGGQYASAGIQSNGTLWTWGNNNSGQLGLSDITNRSSPTQVGTLSAWTQLAIGLQAMAIQNNGTLWTSGDNASGSLGLYNPAAYSLTNYPSQFNTGNYNKVTASNSQSYFRRTADNTVVQTGTADIPTIDTTNSIAWTSYDTGQYHFVGVQTNGTAWSIGNNSYGQLGLNTTTSLYSSLTQIGAGTTWARAIAADYGSMLIDNSNNAWVFGKNNQYQLGLSDTTNRSSPVQITYATGIKNAAMDDNDIWLIDGSNNLWAGGVGNKVSVNTTVNYTYPTQKFTSNFWSNVTTNQDSTLLVSVNSTVYGFGNNTYGQLGISANTNTYQYSPVQIGSINTTTKVETKAGSSIILFK